MTLTATQAAVLDAARARPDRRLEPLPDGLKGGAARKVVDALIARGLAEPGPDGPVAGPRARSRARSRPPRTRRPGRRSPPTTRSRASGPAPSRPG